MTTQLKDTRNVGSSKTDGHRTAYLAIVNERDLPGGEEDPWYSTAGATVEEVVKAGLDHIKETAGRADRVPGTGVWVFKVDKMPEDRAATHVQPVQWTTPEGSYAPYGSEIETEGMKQDWEAMHIYAQIWYNGQVVDFFKESEQFQMFAAFGLVDSIKMLKEFTGPDYLDPATIKSFTKARAEKLGTANLTDRLKD